MGFNGTDGRNGNAGFCGLAVPLGIAEVHVSPHEVVDGEIILPVVEPGAASDDLFELDYRVDRPHEHDVADIPGIDTCGQLL